MNATWCDLISDPLLPLREAAKLVPGGHGRKHSTASRLQRWINHGCRGVKLSAQRTPDGTWLVRPSAIVVFLSELGKVGGADAPMPPSNDWTTAVLRRHGLE